MERIEKTVFVSYRRTNVPWALAIFKNLTNHGYDVFFDFNGIASGDFESVILGNITARAHFLVLLTPSALERCSNPEDWLRREIETALDKRRNIVPLMLEGFDFGSPGIGSQLTGRLAALKHYNALSIPPEYFLEAMGRLRERYLSVPLDAVLHPASLSARQAATEQKAAARTAPAVQEEELTAQQWFERGFNAADPDEKLRFYNNAIRVKPDYADAFNNRGIARSDKGDLEGALHDYNEVIRLKPDHANAFNNRGIARRDKGDLEAGSDSKMSHHLEARCRITTRPSASNPTMPMPSTTGALRGATKATWRARCTITTRPSASNPTMPMPSIAGALRGAPKATWRARCRITTRPSASNPTMPMPSTTVPCYGKKG
jgi:hypothetical protein